MPTYLYALLPSDADRRPDPPPGVRALATAAGTAWVRTLEAAGADRPSPDAHRDVVLLAFAAGVTPLPVRAGLAFPTDAALQEAVAAQADDWRRALARVADAAEMLVYAPLAAAGEPAPAAAAVAPDPSHRGRAYLEGLRARAHAGARAQHDADAWRATLRAAAGPWVRDDALAVHPSGRGLLVSHLVARADAAAYRAALSAAAVGRVVVLGPTVPFSFAAVPPPAAAAVPPSMETS